MNYNPNADKMTRDAYLLGLEVSHSDERLPIGTCIAIWIALDLALICSIVFICGAVLRVVGWL